MEKLPMYSRDLNLLIVNKSTKRYMPQGMFVQAIKNFHIVVIPDGQGFVVAMEEDFSKMYEIIDLEDTNLPIP